MFSYSGLTEDGNEIHFQVNHLSHFLLTLELLPLLLDSASQTGDSRVVILSSTGHTSGVFDPTNMNGERDYGRMKVYCNTKLYNVCLAKHFVVLFKYFLFLFDHVQVMHGFALQRRLKNVGITVSSVHPGFVCEKLELPCWL